MDPEPQLAESTAIDRAFAAAERRKSEGTTAFKDGAFEDAAAHYQGALTLAASCTESAENAVPKRLLLLSLRLNCAAALLKIGQPADALEHCEAALVLDQCSTKALYRKGQALLELAQPALARSTLMDAYKLAPKDKQIRVLLHKADVAAKEVKAKRQSRLFRALADPSNSSTPQSPPEMPSATSKRSDDTMVSSAADVPDGVQAMPNLAFYCRRREISSSCVWNPSMRPPPLPCFSVVSQQNQFGTTRLLVFNGNVDELIEAFSGRDNFAYTQLENRHDYIQWLFPSPERSRFNAQSTPLSVAEAEAIQADDGAMTRIRRAYQLIVDFWGFELVDLEIGTLRCSAVCEARFANLNTAFNHNFMRISRVLNCLNATGWKHYVQPMLKALYIEVYETRRLVCCNQSFASHWVQQLGKDWQATARCDFPKVFDAH